MRPRVLALAFGLGLALWSLPQGPAPAQPPVKKAAPKKSAAAPARPAGEKSGLNKQHLEGYLRHMYLWAPQVKVEVGDFTPSPVAGLLQITVRASFGPNTEQMTFYVSADGKHILAGNLHQAAEHPFRGDISKITTSLQPSFGTPGASVVLVNFSDFQCPHCRDEAKVLRENILKAYPTQVRVYFKDFPLSNHDWARAAAIAGRCIFRQDPLAFWTFHDWAFDKQAEINAANFREKLTGILKDKEIDPLQLNRCIDKRETEAEVDKQIVEGRSLRVNSTPTVFINGRRVGNVPWPTLQQYIDREIEYQKTAKNAGEQECCEVRLPGLPAGNR